MKKYCYVLCILVFVVAIIMSFVACNSEDDINRTYKYSGDYGEGTFVINYAKKTYEYNGWNIEYNTNYQAMRMSPDVCSATGKFKQIDSGVEGMTGFIFTSGAFENKCSFYFKNGDSSSIYLMWIDGGMSINDLEFYDETPLQSVVYQLYGEQIQITQYKNKSSINFANNDAEILQVLVLENGDYVIKSLGKHSFQDGWISIYVSFGLNDNKYEVKKVIISDYDSSQKLMEKVTENRLATFVGLSSQSDLSPSQIVTGATYSASAIKNAVNCAITYVNNI